MKYFVSMVFLLIVLPGFGQFHKKPCTRCYIVTNAGDTLYCAIENNNDFSHVDKIKVQLKGQKKTQNFIVKDIKVLRMPGKFYEKVNINNDEVLLERIVNGPVTLYQDYLIELSEDLSGEDQPSFQIQSSEIYSRKQPVYYLKIDGTVKRLDFHKFRNELAEALKDHKELSGRILEQELEYRDVMGIVKEYNRWKRGEMEGNK